MANDKFKIGDAVSHGWDTFKKHWALLIVAILIPEIIGYIPDIFKYTIGKDYVWISVLLGIFIPLFNMNFQMGTVKILIKSSDGTPIGIGDLFSCFHLFFKILIGSLLFGIIIIVGLLLLIIPGIIWFIKYHYYWFLIVDKEMGPIEAIKHSGKITQGVKWDLFLFGWVVFGLILVGLLACLIGVFVTIPVAGVAGAYIYRKLEPKTNVNTLNPQGL